MKTLLRTMAAIGLLALLQACGGGGDYYDEQDRAFIGPPDCKARPEQCI